MIMTTLMLSLMRSIDCYDDFVAVIMMLFDDVDDDDDGAGDSIAIVDVVTMM